MNRSSNRRPSLALVLAASLLASAVAPQARAAEPTAAEKTTARALMHDGKALRDAQDHAGALSKFAAAYALFATPITGLAVAREQIALDQIAEARETLSAIDRMPVRPTESEDGARARAEARVLLAELASKSEPPPPTPLVGAQEASPTKVGAAAPAATTAVPVDEPKPKSGTAKTAGLIMLAAGGVGLGVGGVLGLSARASYDSAKSAHCPTGACDADGLAGVAAARDRAGTATIVVGLGAALAVGGAVLWFTAPSAHGGESTPAPPSVGLGPGSVTIAGRF